MQAARRVALLLLGLISVCRAQGPRATAPAFQALPLLRVTQQGITAYLEANPDYSLFLQFLESDSYYTSLVAQAWSQGPTNNTLLVPTNEAIEEGLEQISAVYGVPSNASTYIMLAAMEGGGTSSAAATVISAILGSHVFPGSIAFYSNSTILNSTIEEPIALPTLTLSNAAAPRAFSTSEGIDDQIAVFQPSGLLISPVMVPQQYINQRGRNNNFGGSASLYLYEVTGILVASEVVTNAGMQVSVMDALEVIKAAGL